MPMSMMPMSMMPNEPPVSVYGAPAPTMAPMSSYDPGWEPSNGGGPYSRIWTNDRDSSQNIAYSAYYPGPSSSSTTRSIS